MPSVITLPDGSTAIDFSSDPGAVQRKIASRHEFSMDYCRRHGWPEDPTKLSISQIMEIRSEQGWKDSGS